MRSVPMSTPSNADAGSQARACNKCGIVRAVVEFPIKAGTRRHGICKECFRAYSRKHYVKYRQRYLDRAAANRAEIVARVRKLKESTPCADCKLNFPYYVMDFDHLDSDEKDCAIATAIQRSYSWRKVRDEIAKCEIVCANCHRIRTFRRLAIVQRDVV